MIVSAGKDGIFQTTCLHTTAQGDDLAVYINESDIRYAKGGIGGFQHTTKQIAPITANDNMNLSGDHVKPLNDAVLPLVDPQSNTISFGTLGYQIGASAERAKGMYIHDGLGKLATNWHKLGNSWPVPDYLCQKVDGTFGKMTFLVNIGYGSWCASSDQIPPGTSRTDRMYWCGGMTSTPRVKFQWNCVGSCGSPPSYPACVNSDETYGQVQITSLYFGFDAGGGYGPWSPGIIPADTPYYQTGYGMGGEWGSSGMSYQWSCQ